MQEPIKLVKTNKANNAIKAVKAVKDPAQAKQGVTLAAGPSAASLPSNRKKSWMGSARNAGRHRSAGIAIPAWR